VTARTQGLFPSEATESHLQALFAGIGTAVEQGRLMEAVRLADSVCRIAPSNPTCRLVHARLLMQTGAVGQAIERLRGRDDPEAVLTRAEALLLRGSPDDARACVENLLHRYAVDAVENLRQLAGRLSRPPSKIPGWIGVASRLRLVGDVQNELPVAISYEGRIRHPAILAVNASGLASFDFEMPAGVTGPVTAFSGHLPLLGSPFAWPPDFQPSGWVLVEDQALVGKVLLEWAPTLAVTLAITASAGNAIRVAVPTEAGSAPFRVPLDGPLAGASEIHVSVELPDGTQFPLAGSPIRLPAIVPAPIGTRPARNAPAREAEAQRIVDIVVPAYTELQQTLACLERVLETTSRTESELVVVNDASPDPELCAALERWAQDGRITLLTNPVNLGFPGAANRGMRLHPDRDVVLLNSDAEASGDWLDRLKCAAYSADDIGTVTPLGEAASIMSYPGRGARTSGQLDCAQIDRIARQVNPEQLLELPVGVGFCLYIKRACLDETGRFDESTFGAGYGEENDFCLRARRKGWRHMGAANLFVGHAGGKSFGRSKEVLMERNARVLNALHPGYDTLIADFLAADPLLAARRAIDAERLRQQSKDPVLLVTFDLPGGVKRHVDQRQSELAAAGHTVLILQPAGASGREDRVVLKTPDSTLESLVYQLPQEAPALASLLRDVGLSRDLGAAKVELHHFVGLPAAALELVTGLGLPYDIYVHDYSWICPRITLVGGDNRYCGEPPVSECETCIRTHGGEMEESLTVAALRTRSAGILGGARQVIVPAADVRLRLARYFPGVPMKVSAWEAPIQPRPRSNARRSGRIRVAVLGAIGIQKGYEVLLECARDAARRDLNLEFVVIGYTVDDAPLLATERVFVTGFYAENEAAALLEREQCQVALFPAVAPETWCYALTHAMAASLPIAAFDFGAIAERLKSYDAAELLPFPSGAEIINNSLMALIQRTIFSDIQNIQTEQIHKEHVMSDAPPLNQELEASAKILTLPAGVYAFTVQGAPATISPSQLAVPALQLGLAPMKSAGTVEFLPGAGTLDRWLTRSTDTFIVRISGGSVSLMLTSVRFPNSAVLTINVQRIDAEPQTAPPEFQGSQAGSGGLGGFLPVQMLAHVENFGDIYFNDGRAGFNGQKLRLEAFSILSAGPLAADSIEYSGVMADGYQTPWLSNQVLCGSRGRGMPLTAFAVRLKPEIAEHYDCTYIGKFVSGAAVGPLKAGVLCRSNIPGDPLEAIELQISDRSSPEPEEPPGEEMEYTDAES
jgi:GT2 family glycosyltransferase/glycosyltransferase involved in cell wall biosynthesis